MKNIKVPQRVGNSIVKHAYLELIADSIKKITKSTFLELDGYESDTQRVTFTYGGKKCRLYGVYLPTIETPLLSLCLMVGKERYDVPIHLTDFRFTTLDRIAYEIYDYCKGADDDDYEDVRKEYIAQGMDAYREFMS